MHIAVSSVPAPFIMVHAHLQQVAGKYKETMATVILANLYHFAKNWMGIDATERHPNMVQGFVTDHEVVESDLVYWLEILDNGITD